MPLCSYVDRNRLEKEKEGVRGRVERRRRNSRQTLKMYSWWDSSKIRHFIIGWILVQYEISMNLFYIILFNFIVIIFGGNCQIISREADHGVAEETLWCESEKVKRGIFACWGSRLYSNRLKQKKSFVLILEKNIFLFWWWAHLMTTVSPPQQWDFFC